MLNQMYVLSYTETAYSEFNHAIFVGNPINEAKSGGNGEGSQ
jgi:hypothetical protein